MVIGNMTADAATTLARQIQQQGADGNEWCRNKDVVVNRQQLAIFNKAGNSTDSALAAVFAPPNVDEFSSTAASTLLGRLFSRGSTTSCVPKSSSATRSLPSR
jgi:protease-3